MLVINANGVNDAWHKGWRLLHQKELTYERQSRAGRTLEAISPVATVYKHPTRRVLFDPIRNANPFFHFMEALWILAGRRDVEWLTRYNARMAEYSDDRVNFHAAYGHRLRNHFYMDQLREVMKMLRENPETRRAVLQIWDADYDLNHDSKDIPCNDLVFLSMKDQTLDMTVCCRSNDAIWGCYGANAVQFSVLLEYLAGGIGARIGTYTQISNNLHIYIDSPDYDRIRNNGGPTFDNHYEGGYVVASNGLFLCREEFDNELQAFIDGDYSIHYLNRTFPEVAIPMAKAYAAFRDGFVEDAMLIIQSDMNKFKSPDWRVACINWLRRKISRENHNG